MQIPVLLEPVASNGYRASTGQPLSVSAEGSTRAQALEQLRRALQDRLNAGAEIASLEFPGAEHPLVPYAGMFKENPLFEAWQQAVADHRRHDEEAPERP
jgi:predicted RNase H-like HicB family nuclease